MTFGEKLDRIYIDGRKEGQDRLLIRQVCRKLSMNMSVTEIAEDLVVDEVTIARICEAAEKFAPEYDQDAIYDELQKESLLISAR